MPPGEAESPLGAGVTAPAATATPGEAEDYNSHEPLGPPQPPAWETHPSQFLLDTVWWGQQGCPLSCSPAVPWVTRVQTKAYCLQPGQLDPTPHLPGGLGGP